MTPEEMRARFEERESEKLSATACADDTQTEKSRKAILEEIRAMIIKNPEMSNKDIALEVGATPTQVANQRYLMKGKAAEPKEQTEETPAEVPVLRVRVKKAEFAGRIGTYDVDDGNVYIPPVSISIAALPSLVQELQSLIEILKVNEGAGKDHE
ncbi:MAG: hypothetical protein J6Y20_07345 [Lachnospiraceae bacterium]|nr:hypothetical protein [Lachnospiraceae bacterium]